MCRAFQPFTMQCIYFFLKASFDFVEPAFARHTKNKFSSALA